MSSQKTMTNFFSVKRKPADQHPSKRRKAVVQDDVKDTKEEQLKEQTTVAIVTSAVDEHSVCPKTPSTAPKDGTNSRSSKRGSKEATLTPSTKENETRFTVGSSEPTTQLSAKKKLNMSNAEPKPTRNVPFTKLSAVSPKKTRGGFSGLVNEQQTEGSPKFKVPTPVKELVGARRPRTKQTVTKQLFQEDEPVKTSETEKRRRGRAEIEKATEAVKKLTPEELSSKLGKTGKLSELKKRMKALREEATSINKVEQKVEGKVSLSIPGSPGKAALEISVPVSPRKNVARTPTEKASPSKVPAYQRFAYLTRPVETTLPLPYNYRLLAEVFRCTDTVASMLFNRKERIVLPKLTKAVQNMMRKNFGEKFLKQIKCVFPQAYFYAWEKIMGKFGVEKTDEYELRITPNLKYKKDILTDLGAIPDDETTKGKLGPEMLVERKHIFHNSLLQITKDQHRTFLASLDPPISVQDDQLSRWHKNFNLDACMEIDTVDLPVKPHVERMTTAAEVLEKANQIFNINPRLGDSLAETANKIQAEADKQNEEATASEAPKVSEPEVPKALKGLNPKLLERIRAKEAQKARIEMTRNNADILKIKQFSRLPALARILRSLFVSEKKSTMPQEFVLKKLIESHPSCNEKHVLEADLKVLSAESGGWLSLPLVRTLYYVRIDAGININTVCADIETKLKALENKQ